VADFKTSLATVEGEIAAMEKAHEDAVRENRRLKLELAK
jgi:regulator of replication initiation timing